jgi:hypothetical protein
MNPEEMVVKPATGAQCATLALKIAVELTKKFEKLSFVQAQIAIIDPNQLDIGKLAEKFANEIFLIPIDLWGEEKRKISHFYKSCFKDKKWKNPDLEHALFPEITGNLKRPDYIFSEMNEVIDVAFDSYAEFFGKDKAWKAWEKIANAMDYESIQPRPRKDYVFLHVGGDEPDLLDKSYDDGISENIIFMTPLEGIISAFRYRFETGKMYDVIGLTRLSALDQDGYAMGMCKGDDGKFSIGSLNRGNRHSNCGLRQVKVSKPS